MEEQNAVEQCFDQNVQCLIAKNQNQFIKQQEASGLLSRLLTQGIK